MPLLQKWHLLQMLCRLFLRCFEPVEGVHIEQIARYAVQSLRYCD